MFAMGHDLLPPVDPTNSDRGFLLGERQGREGKGAVDALGWPSDLYVKQRVYQPGTGSGASDMMVGYAWFGT
jgi:hypothetical protein